MGASGVTDTQATVTWSAGEASDGTVIYGPAKPPTASASDPAYVTAHSFQLSGLQPCTISYYEVRSTDRAGNLAADGNRGVYYSFETLGNFGSGLQPCHRGTVTLDAAVYGCSNAVNVTLINMDLNVDPSVADSVTIETTSTSEPTPELLVLTETGPATSTFRGVISTDPGNPVPDGKLQTGSGDVLTVTYHDGNDGTGMSRVAYAAARTDCAGPAITNVAVADEPPGRVTISWNTSESASGRLDYGPITALGQTVILSTPSTSQSATLRNLGFCGTLSVGDGQDLGARTRGSRKLGDASARG